MGTAPEELPLLRPASERYFADPEKALRERRPQQEVLSFGGEAVVALPTPIVLSVATDVLTEFATEIANLEDREESRPFVLPCVDSSGSSQLGTKRLPRRFRRPGMAQQQSGQFANGIRALSAICNVPYE